MSNRRRNPKGNNKNKRVVLANPDYSLYFDGGTYKSNPGPSGGCGWCIIKNNNEGSYHFLL